MAKKTKRKLTKFAKILLDLVIVIALGVAAFCGYQIYDEFSERKKGADTYEEIINQNITTVSEEDVEKFAVDYDALYAINSDFLGWIRLEDSTINYPFVQGTDNDYYLTHLFDGTYNNSGSIFMDYDNNPDFSDQCTVLYGHHMFNGSMFADVENYKDPAYYATHKTFEIYTPTQDYTVSVVAGILTNGSADYIQLNFSDEQSFIDYVNSFVSQSTFTSETVVTGEDRIVMLSTCSYDVTDGRYVLIGKLEPIE